MGWFDGEFIHYIQTKLYEGRKPNDEGYYVFTRKELAEGTNRSPSTFDRCRFEVEYYFSEWCDLKKFGKYPEYSGEILYIDVKYEKGKFMFKRNPITFKPELEHLWALPPIDTYFAYDYFDDKHRRRHNGDCRIYDSFPWHWTEDQIQQALKEDEKK